MGSAVHQLCVSFKLITQQLREKWAVITPFHSRLDRWNALSLLANCHHIQLLFAVYYFCILIKSNYRLEKYEKHECWAFFKNRRPFSPFRVDGFAMGFVSTASGINILHPWDCWGSVCLSQLLNNRVPTQPPMTWVLGLLLPFILFLWFWPHVVFHFTSSGWAQNSTCFQWESSPDCGAHLPSPCWWSSVNLSSHSDARCDPHILRPLRWGTLSPKVTWCWLFVSWLVTTWRKPKGIQIQQPWF